MKEAQEDALPSGGSRRTCVLPKEGKKLHLWRFPKEAKYALTSGGRPSFRKKPKDVRPSESGERTS